MNLQRLSHPVDVNDTPCGDTASTSGTFAVLGTGSDVGKSIITAGLCRVLTRAGVRVAPFKAQNMSNNAAPALIIDDHPFSDFYSDDIVGSSSFSPGLQNGLKNRSSKSVDESKLNKVNGVGSGSYDGDNSGGWGEIGTAQALQALACGLIPRVEMNPILLKSGGKSENGTYLCSIIILGKYFTTQPYGVFKSPTFTSRLVEMVLQAHKTLRAATKSEVVVCEGAGSCTELNLMERDVVNLPLVRRLHCPWFLVADIDKGGVFAQIVGTKACITPADWDLCCGVIINKLRGDPEFFEPGPSIIKERVGKPVFVIPWLHGLHLPEEDGVGVETRLAWEKSCTRSKSDGAAFCAERKGSEKANVVVVAYPNVAIDSDLLPLEQDNRIHLMWHRSILPPPFPETQAVVLPGSRLTRSDLHWLTNKTRWGEYLKKHVELGGSIFGICGGYQMLGEQVHDETGVEGTVRNESEDRDIESKISTRGLGLLPVVTYIETAKNKIVSPRTAIFEEVERIEGFELHCGRTSIAKKTEEHNELSNMKMSKSPCKPLLFMDDTNQWDGMRCGNVAGCYLHGILANHFARSTLLNIKNNDPSDGCSIPEKSNNPIESLDILADHLESCGLTAENLMRMYMV